MADWLSLVVGLQKAAERARSLPYGASAVGPAMARRAVAHRWMVDAYFPKHIGKHCGVTR